MAFSLSLTSSSPRKPPPASRNKRWPGGPGGRLKGLGAGCEWGNRVAEEDGEILGYILGACSNLALTLYLLPRLPLFFLKLLLGFYGPPSPTSATF